MLKINGPANLKRVVVLNPKGGSGKTTLAFNLAGYLAATGRNVALVDMDPLGSSMHWLGKRPPELPGIHGVAAPRKERQSGRRDAIDVPGDTEIAVIDAPAGVAGEELSEYTVGAHAILLPVMPSDLDIHAATGLIKDLLLVARVSRANRRLGVIANRVKTRTIAYGQLMRFLERLSIEVVGVVRDSQNYVAAAHGGLCIFEMQRSRVAADLKQWTTITGWLEKRLATPLNERDLRESEKRAGKAAVFAASTRRRPALSAAAAIGTIAVGMALFWNGGESPMEAGPEKGVATSVALVSEKAETVSQPGDESVPAPAATAEVDVTPAGEAVEPALSPGEEVKQRWQLSGIAQAGDASVVILKDRNDQTTHQVITGAEIDGWVMAEAGRDFAVLTQDGERVRLDLNERLLR